MEKAQAYLTLTDANFQSEVLNSAKPVLVEIGADWCGCCHIMEPIIDRLAIDMGDQLKFGKIDIDTNEQMARDFGVSDLPILLLFKDGQLIDHIIGPISRKELKARITSGINN
jgi:thioredoxin 1